MENEIKRLIKQYTTMREQSRNMKLYVKNADDIIKLDAGIVTFDLVIEDLKELLSVSEHETPKVGNNEKAREVCGSQDDSCKYKGMDNTCHYTLFCIDKQTG